MFRTRDFILIFVTVVFLVVAISATAWQQRSGSETQVDTLQLVETDDQEYTAQLSTPETLSREERLSEMRRKIAESGKLTLSDPETVTTEPSAEVEVSELPAGAVLLQCPSYQLYSGQWSPAGIQFEVTEGARLVYRETVTEQRSDPLATSSTPEMVTDREILLQLPLQPVKLAQSTCLPSDVIGIAQDGSLIRNTEVGLYGIFGANTLIGYALDGFPIYGTSDAPTDSCGGSVVAGAYRYSLSQERDVILNCFAAQPASF